MPDTCAPLDAERAYVAGLYERLDAERADAAKRLARAERSELPPMERETERRHLAGRVQALGAAGDGLCFGRLDTADGDTLHVGRIGLHDTDRDETLLLDWRAPASSPFYTATAVRPQGVRRRRHLRTRGRRVLTLHDDVFGDGADATGADTALLSALDAPREGAMRDIVATIQAEQDEIIRLADTGVVVVEGGPGTGKTAVALHRVAHLLYAHRDRLARRGVLVVGPNAGFLGYVGSVLPALGETSVVYATPGTLFPGLVATAEDAPAAARLKGSLDVLDVLSAAVADRQELPGAPVRIDPDGTEVLLDAEVAARARASARASGKRHNAARGEFRAALVAELAERWVTGTEAALRAGEQEWGAAFTAEEGDPAEVDRTLRAELRADARDGLGDSAALDDAVERLWPALTPQRLLAELLSSPDRIAAATPGLSDADRAALYRTDPEAWTTADAPLLDELAELLGPRPEAGRAEREAARAERAEREWAAELLDVLAPDVLDRQYLIASDLVDAGDLADRHAAGDTRVLAERAVADREWTYGHVVVDEAQELSAMDWRMLMRRCPSRSMTVVGDLAQRQSPAGAPSWAAVLDPYVPGRITHRALTVNYRTPAEVMDVAARVLEQVDPALAAPRSVRSTGAPPWVRAAARTGLAGTVAAVLEALAAEPDGAAPGGTAAAVVPEDLWAELAGALPATVLTPRSAKGLEFDRVVVVEPGRMAPAQLYVALTRATRRLAVVHTEPLPETLAGLVAG